MSAQRVSAPSGLKFGVDDLRGVAVFPPTPALPHAAAIDARDTVDLAETERMIHSLIDSGVDAILTNGTLGEGPSLSTAEWKQFSATVAETASSVNEDFPIFVGATTLNTRDTAERIEHIRSIGLRGVLLGRPMWCALGIEPMIEFYESLANAYPDMSFVLYDNPDAFRGPIPPPVYARIAAIPNIIGVKAAAISPKFRADVSAVAGRMRILPIEVDWFATNAMFPDDIVGCWSASAMCGPEPLLYLRDALAAGDVTAARWITDRMEYTYEAHPGRSDFAEFSKYSIAIEKFRFDEAGFVKAGPARPPYHVFPQRYLEDAKENARRWREVVDEVAAAPPPGERNEQRAELQPS